MVTFQLVHCLSFWEHSLKSVSDERVLLAGQGKGKVPGILDVSTCEKQTPFHGRAQCKCSSYCMLQHIHVYLLLVCRPYAQLPGTDAAV